MMRTSIVWTLLLCAPSFAIELRRDPVGSFGSPNGCSPDMLQGKVYDLPVDTRNLPKFEKLKPSGAVCANILNIPYRGFLEGIPGVTSRIEWFAIDYQGDFWVDTPGSYMFTLASDDGSMLYVDGKTIIDNDGIHAMVELGGRAKLEPGKHHIRISYFQGPREYVGLVLKMAPPKGIFDFFDMRALRPPATQKGSAEVVVVDEARPVVRRATIAHDPLAARAFEVPAFTALSANPRPRDFDFRAKAYRFRSQRAITLEVPGSALTATPLNNGQFRIHVVLLAVLKDPEGGVLQKISEDFPVELPAERLAAIKNATLRLTRVLTLPPGLFVMQAVAVDRESNRASATTLRVDNSAPAGVGLSDLVLVRRVEPAAADASDPLQFESRRVVPELSTSLPAGVEPSVYFVIYPSTANAEKPAITIELSLDGRVVGKQTSALPSSADANGAIPLTIAAPAKPGRNRLRIIIQQGAESVERALEYTVAGAQ